MDNTIIIKVAKQLSEEIMVLKTVVATLQIAFRMNATDFYSGSRSFIYGPSTVKCKCSLCEK